MAARESLFDAARKRAEEVRQWADLNGGELEWLISDESVREAVDKALWLAPDVERLIALYEEATELLQEAYPDPDGFPSNHWRKRVERLGLWPK